eukprot:108473-Amphidinium_carterae.1
MSMLSWHEARVHVELGVGNLCVRCGEAVEDLQHIVHHCPAWNAERREGFRPPRLTAPPLVLSCMVVISHELALVSRPGVHTVWTDGSGRHSSNPHFHRCGVGYYTRTGESVGLLFMGLKQSVYRAELVATVRALEECQPFRLRPGCISGWGPSRVKAHQSDKDAAQGRVQLSDLQVHRKTYVAAYNGTREHVPSERNRHVGFHAGRKNINYHVLKGRPCQPLKRKKRANLAVGFADFVQAEPPGEAEPRPVGVG